MDIHVTCLKYISFWIAAVDDASFDVKDVCKLSEDKDWAFCFIRYTKFDLSLAANAAVKCLQWRKANGIRSKF